MSLLHLASIIEFVVVLAGVSLLVTTLTQMIAAVLWFARNTSLVGNKNSPIRSRPEAALARGTHQRSGAAPSADFRFDLLPVLERRGAPIQPGFFDLQGGVDANADQIIGRMNGTAGNFTSEVEKWFESVISAFRNLSRFNRLWAADFPVAVASNRTSTTSNSQPI